MKKGRLMILALVMLFALSLAGCSAANDEQFVLVFGQNSSELIPTVGNSAYRDRALYEEEGSDDDTDDSSTVVEEDDYVDPTAGLDCSED